MSYALRKDGLGFRSVADASECTESEVWQSQLPNIAGSESDVPVDWVQKLKSFIAANPDVAAGLDQA